MYDEMADLMGDIVAGEDTYLEFKEVRFHGNQVRFASEEGRSAATIAEVFVSMANTEGGVVLFGVNKERAVVGVDVGKRDLLEQFVRRPRFFWTRIWGKTVSRERGLKC